MAPTPLAEPLNHSDKMSPTQENKPPIPTGAGAKKAMEAFFAGNNHMEFRQRSSSASRSTRTFSRGATPSRDAGSVPEGAIDPDALKNALKKIPSLEKVSIRPTPPRSRSISRSHSPLPDEELLDESLPDFYKLTLKPTERTGSQTRDILLGGNRLSRGATPSGDPSVPEFRRVALRRTPSREQLADDQVHRQSTLKKSTVVETSSKTNLSRTGSFTSLTSINKSVLSRRNSSASEEQKPEFKGLVLKKTGSRPGSRAGSPTKQSGSRNELVDGVSLKKVESSSRSSSRRGSAASESTSEFSNVSLKKSAVVKGEQSKFEVEQVSLKPIPVGEEEETAVSSSSVGIRREERASSVSRQRVLRETKFEGGDEEYHGIKSSLDKLKKKESNSQESLAAAATEKAPKPAVKTAAPPQDDAAAKPIVYRRRRKPSDEEEGEKVNLKPVKLEKRQSFTSSIECVKKAVVDEEEAAKRAARPTNLRRMSFTSSLDNIAVADQKPAEKVHLSCFSKEMGSNVDLVQVCQGQEEGKHEVKLEFEIEGQEAKAVKQPEEKVLTWTADETVVDANAVDNETGERLRAKEEDKEEEEEEEEEEEVVEEMVTLHKIRKAPSIDGLFQRQDVQAAFTFTLPYQNEEPATKLSLEIPNLS